MKKWLYCALLLGALRSKEINATPYAGSIAGAGQGQRALVSGYEYSPLRQGPAPKRFGRRSYPQGRVLKGGFSKARYFRRYRYIEEDPNPATVHSRNY